MMEANGTRRAGQGPGKRLHEARLQARLSPEQVAELLHLSPEQIIALENDDFDRLPGPTYVRGYLRSYSQLLGLPAREILESYGKLNGSGKSPSIGRLAPAREPTTRDAPVRLAVLLVLGIFVLLAVVWWQGREELPVPAVTSAPEPELNPAPPSSSPPALGTQPPMTPAAETASSAETPVLPVPDSAAVAPPAESSALGAQTPAELGAQAGSGGELNTLVLRTREECWIDIRDARDNKLVYALVPAGQRLFLSGTPPFTIFLGNPDGVTLEYQGDSIDASRYKRGLVARFTLGAARAGAR